MQSIVKLPECSICTDVIEDPRHLPCGHSYCGPPKTCLDMLQSEGILICALCKEEHKINISDLKPMYGLREFLRNQKETSEGLPTIVSSTSQKRLHCFVHPNTPVTLWCKVCQETMCANCVEFDKHSEHQFVPFAKNLHSIVSQQAQKLTEQHMICIREFDEKIRELEPKLQKSRTLLEELKTARNSFEAYWAEIEAFINEKGNVPDNHIIMWLFRGNIKSVVKTVCENFWADACCSTEFIIQKDALTQTNEMIKEPACKNALTQTNCKRSEIVTQTQFSEVDVGTQTSYLDTELDFAKKSSVSYADTSSVSDSLFTTPSMRDFDQDAIDLLNIPVMFNHHFLSIIDIKINRVVVEFSYDPQQTGILRSNRLVCELGIIVVTVERKEGKLKASIRVMGSEKDPTLTVRVQTPTMRDYFIWNNETMTVRYFERLTTLPWKRCRLQRWNGCPPIIRLKVYFL